MAVPETDGWVYEGYEPVDGQSYVCSAYVAALLREGGIFGDIEINATEFTPGDISDLNIFDDNGDDRPDVCIGADPKLPYC